MERRRILAHTQLAAIVLVVAVGAALGGGVASASQVASSKAPSARTYVVRAGDGGWLQIAKAHGVTMPHLLAANHATPATRVVAGEKIALPPAPKSKAKSAVRPPTKHAPALAPSHAPAAHAPATH
jgi:LysM repeat protein